MFQNDSRESLQNKPNWLHTVDLSGVYLTVSYFQHIVVFSKALELPEFNENNRPISNINISNKLLIANGNLMEQRRSLAWGGACYTYS